MTLKKLVRTPKNSLSQVANRLKEINFNADIKIHRIVPVTNYVKTKTIDFDNHKIKNTFTSITWNEMNQQYF